MARLRKGDFAADGLLPLNTHGGLLAFGHSGVAGGLMHLAEAARQKTRTARLENERGARLPRHQPRRDPSREMFAIDTGNPDLPTYEIDEFNDPRRKN